MTIKVIKMNNNYISITKEIDRIHSRRRELNNRENILQAEILQLLK